MEEPKLHWRSGKKMPALSKEHREKISQNKRKQIRLKLLKNLKEQSSHELSD